MPADFHHGPLERRRLTVDAGRALVFAARQHETHGAQAPGQFLRGIDSRNRMRMQPRRTRRGRHEHHDRPHKAVKHTRIQGKTNALAQPRQLADFCGFASRPDYDFGVSDTNLVRRYCTVTVGLVAARVYPSFRNSRN